MTIDEAIECERNHRLYPEYQEQLAEWLEDYKRIKMLIPIEQALKAEYNKALDDIVTIIKERVGMDWEWDFCFIEQIAEQLKAGWRE